MFSSLKMYATDPILELAIKYKEDDKTNKVDMTVGVYQNDIGEIPIMKCVEIAQDNIVADKSYMPVLGANSYCKSFERYLTNDNSDCVTTCYTLGGTGAVRLIADIIKQSRPDAAIWCSDPTWSNHFGIFDAVGVTYNKYRYQYESNIVDLDKIKSDLSMAKEGDIVLLHGCCHNPSGVDLLSDQWKNLFQFMKENKLIPFFDIAYDGFSKNHGDDRWSFKYAYEMFEVVFLSYSFSKILGLYGERSGGLLIKAPDKKSKILIESNLKKLVRSTYSNPPVSSVKVTNLILESSELQAVWYEELATSRERLVHIRNTFQNLLTEHGSKICHLKGQRGLFSLLDLSIKEVHQLRNEYGIYLLDNGRANLAGLNDSNVNYVANAIANL
jgi:aromatic-amino-acid transaminase